MKLLKNYVEFRFCIYDLIDSPAVKEMNSFTQHSNVTTLEHCIFVAFISFLICKFFGLNYYAAARGGLLHDLFLYDWHDDDRRGKLHGLTHPTIALKNASLYFNLTEMEKDIILKHMWPITISLPKYKESFVVGCADKLCASMEVLGMYKLIWIQRIVKLKTTKEKTIKEMISAANRI